MLLFLDDGIIFDETISFAWEALESMRKTSKGICLYLVRVLGGVTLKKRTHFPQLREIRIEVPDVNAEWTEEQENTPQIGKTFKWSEIEHRRPQRKRRTAAPIAKRRKLMKRPTLVATDPAEISEPGDLLIESDGGPERFAEIALMKPISVDMENRSNIAIRG
ncbi:hypothetical protein N7501_001684 [Penicillium viridicatum]|nr:hypothetical protein N7501_001684 [Penicillium viridicatum]